MTTTPPGWVTPDDPLVAPPYGGVNAWFARIVGVVRRGWRPILLILLVTQVVPATVLALGSLAYLDTFNSSPLFGPEADSLTQAEADAALRDLFGSIAVFVGVVLFAAVVLSLLQAAGYAAATWLMVRQAAGEPAGVGPAFRYGARRMFGLWGWTLLSGLIITAGVCLCFLPSIYFAYALSLAGPVYLFERRNPIGRSWRLTHANSAVLGRIAIIAAVVVGGSMLVSVGQQVVLAISGETQVLSPLTVTLTVAVVLASLPATLVQVVSLVVTYAEQRVRETPWSTAHMTTALALGTVEC